MSTRVKRWDIFLVDLNPTIGTKPGKIRPVLVVQHDALNDVEHPSTVILPITTNIQNKDEYPLRIFLPKDISGLNKDSVVLVDQILAWDNRRFIKKVGSLTDKFASIIEAALKDFFGW